MRWPLAIVTLAGCDAVFLDRLPPPPSHPLESETHDEDGDEAPDARDLCPHLALATEDADGDGVGNACDPRPEDPDDRYFFAFEAGDTGILERAGTIANGDDGDSIVLGSVQIDHSALVLPRDLAVVDVEVGVELVQIKTVVPGEWAELGLYSAHRGFDTSNQRRGDVCFYGTDREITNPNYLEFDNDDVFLGEYLVRFGGSIAGDTGTFAHARTPDDLACAFARGDGSSVSQGGPHRAAPRAETGAVALVADKLTANIRYLWIVTPRP